MTSSLQYNDDIVFSRNYQKHIVTSEIHSLDISVHAADFTISYSDTFYIESDLKNLSISESNGILTVVDKTKFHINATPRLRLFIPNNSVFQNVNITTGAGALTVTSLSAIFMNIKLGAGPAQFMNLNAQATAFIKGGAGVITINSGIFNNLTLHLGVGNLNMASTLLGTNNLKLGIGATNLTLIGRRDNYILDVKKGIGAINIIDNNVPVSVNPPIVPSYVNIIGSIGSANITFQG